MSIQLLLGFPKRHMVRTGGARGMEWIHSLAVGSGVFFPFPLLTPIDFHYKNENAFPQDKTLGLATRQKWPVRSKQIVSNQLFKGKRIMDAKAWRNKEGHLWKVMLNSIKHEVGERIPFRKNKMEKVVPLKKLKQMWTFTSLFTFFLTHLFSYSTYPTDLCCMHRAWYRREKDKLEVT